VAAIWRAADEVLGLARAGAPPFDGTLAAWHVGVHGQEAGAGDLDAR
jgi:hypothetical protein